MGSRPRARKRFGQHFLERAWIEKVIRAIGPQPTDVFLEIGPGPGGLTRPLAAASSRVVGVEIDRDLAAALETSGLPNLSVVEGDFLAIAPERLRFRMFTEGTAAQPVRVAGNLPYNAAAPILFRLLEMHEASLLDGGSTGPVLRLVDATVMLQREVADRLLALVGSKDYGVLTILVGRLARIDRLLDLPPGAFRPPPKVRSTVVRLTFHPSDPPVRDGAEFTALVRAIFTRRRKTIANALLAYRPAANADVAELLCRAGIEPTRRPESLHRKDLALLTDLLIAARPHDHSARSPR
jgi:16S rRNA (adenine1518-N6/adenine1519-N6)-dimethyltransferase